MTMQARDLEPIRRASRGGTTKPDPKRSRRSKARAIELRQARRRKGGAR